MITILPESEGNMLGVRATAQLTDADYTDIWVPTMEAIIDKYGKVRALLYMDAEFEGWEASALWDDAKFGLKHNDDFEKIAIVGGPRWVRWSINLLIPFLKCQVKMFRNSQLENAWQWLKRDLSEEIG
jgi:SpoIIAA-like